MKISYVEISLFPSDLRTDLMNATLDSLRLKNYTGVLKFMDHGFARECKYCGTDECIGFLTCVYYFKDGKVHNKNGPAILSYVNGMKNPLSVVYMQNDIMHRENEAAEIWYDNWYPHSTGKITIELFFSHGIVHKAKIYRRFNNAIKHSVAPLLCQLKRKIKVEIYNE